MGATLQSQQLEQPAKLQGITARAVAVGLLLVVILCVVTPYTDLVMRTTLIACDHLPVGVLTLFLAIVTLVNALLRRIPVVRPFSSAELITIYAMMLVAAGIPSFGLTSYLLPVISAPYYYGRPEGWLDRLHQFIPNWFGPSDTFAANRYYEGLKAGEGIPWGAWVAPLVGWSVFIFALYLVIFCLASVIRRQWVDRERLSFPLVQLPLEMARGEDGLAKNPFFRNKLLWIGVAIPAVVHSVNAVHSYLPMVPAFNIKWVELSAGLGNFHPWSAARPVFLFVYFSVIGVAYLLSSEVGLSLWLFHFIYKLQSVAAATMGYDTYNSGWLGQQFIAYQGAGAILAIVAASVWMGRKHFADVVRQALGRQPADADDDEPLSCRFAFWGIIFGTLILTLWLRAAGMSVPVALGLLVLFYAVMVGLAKFVADSGLLMVQAPLQPGDLMTTAVGTARIGAANLPILNIVQFVFMFDMRCNLMPSAMDGFRLADGPRLRRRSLVKAMAVAVVVGVVVSFTAHLAWMYSVGGLNTHLWFFRDAARAPHLRAIDQITNAVPSSWPNIAFTLLGASVAGGMSLLRQQYAAFPLHPIGYAVGSTYAITQMWFSIMVGWLLKTFVLRYGGRQLYVRCLPIMFGLIVGEFGISGLWIVIDMLTGVRGHIIFGN